MKLDYDRELNSILIDLSDSYYYLKRDSPAITMSEDLFKYTEREDTPSLSVTNAVFIGSPNKFWSRVRFTWETIKMIWKTKEETK